jgi:hypothetical protein
MLSNNSAGKFPQWSGSTPEYSFVGGSSLPFFLFWNEIKARLPALTKRTSCIA